jgi:nitrogen fixation/metabolism regulation signal transduction histidine kinase
MEPLAGEAVAQIEESARVRQRGFVSVDGRVYQYVVKASPEPGGGRLVGGILHEASYTGVIAVIQANRMSTSVSRELRPRFVLFLALLFAGVTVIMIGLAFYLSKRTSGALAGPLAELSRAAGRIANGDFKQHVRPAGGDEIRALIENFNSMAVRLGSTTARLAQSERVAAWQQIARRFAHELKNPLQPILVSLYRIEKQTAGSSVYDEIREPLKAASDELRHLTDLADRFSQLAKMPAPRSEPVNLNELVKSVMQLYGEKLEPYEVELHLPESEVDVTGDVVYLREALHNILQNAVDASSPGGKVSVQLYVEDGHAYLSVGDSGAGMDAQTMASARLPYFTTKEKGSGLGLAIVEKSISEMGGELLIKSAAGEGTTVVIALPCSETARGE